MRAHHPSALGLSNSYRVKPAEISRPYRFIIHSLALAHLSFVVSCDCFHLFPLLLTGEERPCVPKDMDLKNLVGQSATICTIAVFLSGIEICKKIWAKKSTSDISALPFLCGFISCSFWLRYGLLINDSALIIVNTTGAILQALYTMWYAKYASERGIFYKQLSVVFSAVGVLYLYTTYSVTDENAVFVSGIAACSAGVIFMGSPLASMAHVLRTKNVESLPFYMILTTFVMATLWFFYGVLTSDKFVQIPNFLGAVLALSQLCLFLIFPGKKPYYDLASTA